MYISTNINTCNHMCIYIYINLKYEKNFTLYKNTHYKCAGVFPNKNLFYMISLTTNEHEFHE